QVVPAEPGVLTIAGTRVTSQSCSEGAGYSLGSSSGPIESTDPGSYQPPWVSRQPTLCSYDSHGVLLRVNGKAPDFIQAHATKAAKGTIPSVVGIAVSGAGASFVLMRYPCVSGTSGSPLNRLSRFDDQGNLVWELELPDGDYASLVGAADGGVILNSSSSAARVFHVSASGTIDWAYQSQSAQTLATGLVGQLEDGSFSQLCFAAESTRESTDATSQSRSAQGFVTDPDTGITIAHVRQWNDDGTSQGNSLVTISGDGSRCEMYGLLDSQSTNTKADDVTTVIHSPYVYLQRVTDIRRYRLPTP
ncbi:MAG TPA: hypothetical protein VKP30_08800, partial [Polyangiaceae bacterium]|nr:hypothetical protein [Polyangiaceae bacterium]